MYSKWYLTKKLAKAFANPHSPLLVQMVVSRRCNLSCGYCFEYDNFSKPVPLDELKKRIDHLKNLGTVFVTLNGGEALMNPNVPQIVQYIKEAGMIPLMNSNGWLLKPQIIEELNTAGLYGIQISCDSMEENDITQKSMSKLRPKLDMLKKYAKFKVRVNGVLGSSNPQEVIDVAKIIVSYGFDFQCSLMRDESGQALPLTDQAREVYFQIRNMKSRLPKILNDDFQIPLAEGNTIDWKCRSGARHFEIDSGGFVHYCQPKTGYPNKYILDYTIDDIKLHHNKKKECSKRCPVAYAHLGSRMDELRPQTGI